MISVTELLCRLCASPGTSGREETAAETLTELLRQAAPELKIETDRMGNVTAFLGDKNAPRQILLDAHLDQIGLVVTHITENGFLKVAPVGGIDRRVLPCSAVTVLGRETLSGTVSFLPPHLTGGKEDECPAAEDLSVDIGKTKEEAEALVAPGDRVIVDGEFRQLLGTRVTAAALDDRAGCAALILCAAELSDCILNCGVTFSFTSREETGCEGARTAAYRLNATEALAVDVTFGDQPGVAEEKRGKLGGGPMIGISPSLSHQMGDRLVSLCKEQDIPYALEVMGGTTGTNADVIGVSKEGIPAVTVSIPLRYMHTPAEVIDTDDVEYTAKLLSAYVTGGDQ